MADQTQHRRAHQIAELEAEARMGDALLNDRRAAVREMTRHDGWAQVAYPHLKARLEQIQQAVFDQRLSEEDWRRHQAEAALLRSMIADPVAFFTADVGD